MLNSEQFNPARSAAHHALKHFGEERQLLKTHEELGELSAALARWTGAMEDVDLSNQQTIDRVEALKTQLIEEMADVLFMMTQLSVILDCDRELTSLFSWKVERLKYRMKVAPIAEVGPLPF